MRGRLDPAEIHSIALSRDLQWLAVCSNKETLHVFSLRVRVGGKDAAGHKQSADQAARSVKKNKNCIQCNISLVFHSFSISFFSFGDGGFAWSFKFMHYMI